MAGISSINFAKSRSDSTSPTTSAASPPEPAYALAIKSLSASGVSTLSLIFPNFRPTSAIAAGAVFCETEISTGASGSEVSRLASTKKSRANPYGNKRFSNMAYLLSVVFVFAAGTEIVIGVVINLPFSISGNKAAALPPFGTGICVRM